MGCVAIVISFIATGTNRKSSSDEAVAVLTAAAASTRRALATGMYVYHAVYIYVNMYICNMRVCNPTCEFSLSMPFEFLDVQGRSKTDEIIAEIEASRNPENGLLPLHT